MITDGFTYIAALVFIAAILINLPKMFKDNKIAEKVFSFAPPIVLIYLGLMVLCTVKLWDLDATKDAYNGLKNPLLYVMFLLWAIGFADKFNKWTKSDTTVIDEVGKALEAEAKANTKPLTWQNIAILLGSGLLVSAVSSKLGVMINGVAPFLDKATWTVLIVTALGVGFALTPFGKLKGTEEISNVLLYIVVALIASRADLSGMGDAPIWLLAGFVILLIHVTIMLILAKLLKLDVFTCAVASLANIGGTATAPVLAGTYSSALVPVGIIMALLGYVIGTGGGLIVAKLMSMV